MLAALTASQAREFRRSLERTLAALTAMNS